jgi:hypothetical protein
MEKNIHELTIVELESLDAPGWGDFWSGVAVGVGVGALVVIAT